MNRKAIIFPRALMNEPSDTMPRLNQTTKFARDTFEQFRGDEFFPQWISAPRVDGGAGNDFIGIEINVPVIEKEAK